MTITKKFIDARLEKLILYMNQNNIDLSIISSPENTFYYSHFNPIIYSSPVFVIVKKNGEVSLLLHSLRYLHAQKECHIKNIYLYGKWGNNISISSDYYDAIKIIVNNDSNLNIALEKEHISINFLEKLSSNLKILQIYDISSFIMEKKLIKDSYEISCIKKACLLSDIGVETTIKFLEKGYSEADACTEGQYQMRKTWQNLFSQYEISGFGNSEGGQIDALSTWCMFNERISFGCDCPTSYIPNNGDLILPQSWAKIDCYGGECERSIFVNQLDIFKERAYDTMLEARNSIFSAIKVGIMFEELYFIYKEIFKKNGFENYISGRIGHGIGLSLHEFPSITNGNKIRLTPNMVFTIEPGIMDKEFGGVRHSDTIIITDKGFEFLTNLNRDKLFIIKR